VLLRTVELYFEMPGRFAPQRDLGAIYLEDARIAAGGAQSRRNAGAGQETELHQTLCIFARKIDPVENRRVAASQIHQGCGEDFRLAAVATQLHLGFSMRESEILVNRFPGFPAPFSRHPPLPASKCGKIKDNRMPAPVHVRKFHPLDLDRILQIEHASFGNDAYDRNLFAEYFRKCGSLFLVADGRRGVCGYAVTCIRGGRAELISIAVDPKERGRGAASALLESTLRRLRRRCVARFGLIVRSTNDPARAFYEKYGFRRMRIMRGYYEDGEDGVSMTREV